MTQIRIVFIDNGVTPIDVFISDVYGNNQYLLGTITTTVPPTVTYNSNIPSIFNTAPEIKLTLVDSNNCEVSKILNCDFGCAFEITIEIGSCIVNMNIQQE